VKLKQRHIIILLAVVALLAASVFFIYPPGKKTHLGLDLQGGLQVVYKATNPDGSRVTSAELSEAIAIMNRRVNGIGVTEAQVQKQGSDQISVALPGVTDIQRALSIIGKTAQLEFYDDGQARVAGPAASIADVVAEAKAQSRFAIPAADLKALANPAAPQPSGWSLVTAPAGALGNTSPVYFIYKRPPAMTGSAIKNASQSFDNSQPDVLIDFTSKGGQQFAQITKELAFRGALQQQNQTFAIVLDNTLESDPYVDYKQNPQGITGGSAVISGGDMTVSTAQDLALVLRTGALPVALQPIYQQQVSATLGRDSLKAGLIAGLVGFAVVLIYMVFYYRFLGLIADLALLIYAVLLWGVFNAVPVTLSLPGIAGMILTIGVAADANVVIFERIKEEVRFGKTVRSAITSGYSRGFKTILDANVLTLLTALVLFLFATAQPKGFALTLILGVLVSMFTAVAATRAMLGLLSDYEFFNKASFMGVSAAQMAAAAERQAADEQLRGTALRGAVQRGSSARSAASRAARRTAVPSAAGHGNAAADASMADLGDGAGATDVSSAASLGGDAAPSRPAGPSRSAARPRPASSRPATRNAAARKKKKRR
jgi:protein-export membrane protein SecD